jgi:1-acyl-sn-glycerol-3-phosphate acyltransferase
VSFFVVHVTLGDGDLRRRLERSLTEFMCSIFVASWTGVVKYHGPRPTPGANKVYVANHTSMIDFIILQQVRRLLGCTHCGASVTTRGACSTLRGAIMMASSLVEPRVRWAVTAADGELQISSTGVRSLGHHAAALGMGWMAAGHRVAEHWVFPPQPTHRF